ncbi:MAG TPA: indolepyruvate oxidoreductase subunit beta [Gelria sp.]|jgi:indolepyruvate ferredoxin oxidoreductase beta subunit|nr:indolepyruvate ferredoxin oxidoreductase [Syntrophomonas sp.]HHV16336.1 indolepyruvate oxidoreductase subunit beta [Gelria sp.]
MSKELIKDPLNIIICGVGGQGNILATELLASALVEKGYFATVGETYGASQRGGSVMSHVRISAATEYGVLIPLQQADIIVSFEPTDTLRVARDYANKSTLIITDSRPNYPLGVLIGEAHYPAMEAIEAELRKLSNQVQIIEATKLAVEAGNSQAANVLLMGALTALPLVPIDIDDYERILEQRFSGQVLEMNRKVLKVGYEQVK